MEKYQHLKINISRNILRLMVFPFVFLCYLVIGQENTSDNLIYWNKTQNLNWGDFLGIPPNSFKSQYDTEAKAAAAVKLEYEILIYPDSIDFIVYCIFNKSESWTKDTSSKEVLKHEQLHFDIGELHARKIRKEFINLRENNSYNGDVYDSAFDSLLNVCNNYHDLYDKESLHGAVVVGQEKWNKKIRKELNELEKYYVEY